MTIPSDAGYSSGYAPQDLDDNSAIDQSQQGAFGGTAGYDVYPPGYGQAGPSYAQEGTVFVT